MSSSFSSLSAAAVMRKATYFVSPLLILLVVAFGNVIRAQCPSVATILVDGCITGQEENNEYVIFNSGGGFNLGDLTIDYAMGNNVMGLGQNNDLNTNVDNDPANPAPCTLVPGDLSIFSGGCNLVAVGDGAAIPPGAIVIFQVSNDPTQITDLSVLCTGGQTIYVTRSSCDRTIGAFTNGGSGTRTTNFGFGGGCNESVTYDRSALPGGNGAFYTPCDGGTYGNSGCGSVVDVSSCFTMMCPNPQTNNFEVCVDGPVINPPGADLTPADAQWVGASNVSYHNTSMAAMNNTGEITNYVGSTATSVTLFARVEYPDGCVVIGTLIIDFIPPDGNAGNDATLSTCSGGTLNLLAALGGGVTPGSFTDDDGTGVNLTNPSSVNFTGVPAGSYDFTYSAFDDPTNNCPADMAVVTVNVTAAPMANTPSSPLIVCYTISPPSFTSNLVVITNQISGGIPIQFYLDAAGMQPIDPNNPADQALLIATQPSVVYANFTSGGCPSNIVPINVVVEETPQAVGPQSLTVCGNGSGQFNLSSLDNAINGGTGANVTYYFDVNANNQIFNPGNFTSSGGNVFAVVNANGNCPSNTVTVSLNVSSGPSVQSMFTEPLCNGAATGTISLNVASTNGPFNFNWIPASLNGQEDPENLMAGNYFVTVTDAGGCPTELAFTLTQPNPLTLTNCAELSPASGVNTADGTANVTVTGGTADYTVNFTGPTSGSQTGPGPQIQLNGLLPGNYTVTSVVDDNNCTESVSCNFTITAPVPCDLILQCDELIPASGPGNADGTGTIVYGNGVAPYAVEVTGPVALSFTNQPGGFLDLPNLLPGNYNVTITDADNCTTSCSFSISALNCGLLVTTDTIIQVLCAGDSTGSIIIDTTGTSGPLDISWSTGTNSDSIFLDSLPAGAYFVMVSDPAVPGCDTVLNFTIVEPDSLELSCAAGMFATDSLTADGSANLTINGGTPPYALNISGPTDTVIANVVGPNLTVDSLLPGIYIGSISDSSGCAAVSCSFQIEVTPDCPLMASYSDTPNTCPGEEDATVTLTITGAGGPLDITWSVPGFDDQTVATVGSGVYSVTITDPSVANCAVIIVDSIVDPLPVSILCAAGVTTSAPGAMDAVGMITLDGGTAPYAVDVTGPVPSTLTNVAAGTYSLPNLSEGVYSATVTDANGCTANCSFTVTPTGCTLDVTITSTNVSCNGAADGTISLFISGNVGAVNVDWDQDQYDGQQDIGNLPPGSYSAVIMDASGCSLPIGPITIIDPAPIAIACEVLNDVSSPSAMDGAARGVVTGGTGPYQVILRRFVGMTSIDDTTVIATADTVLYSDLTGSAPLEQEYEFVVVDASGCRDTCAFSIFEPPCPTITFTEAITDVACPGDSSGVISVTVNNGQPPFTYQWTPVQPDTNVLNNVPAGDYQLVVIDSFGCTVTDTFTVNEPTSVPSLSCLALTDETAPGAANGTAQVTVMGDRAPFTIDVFGPTPSSQQIDPAGTLDLSSLASGNYSVLVTDNNGCTTDTCFFFIGAGVCALQVNATVTAEDCAGPGQIALEVTGGIAPYVFDWNEDIYDGQDTISVPSGIYSVVITDAAGCTASTKEIVEVIDNAPQLMIGGNMLACLNDSARLDLQPSGGLPGYTYFFTTSPASFPATATSLADTTIAFPIPVGTGNMFSVTVDSLVDANGCVTVVDESLNYIVNAPDSLVFNELLCSGDTVTLEGMDFYAGNPSDTFFVNSGACGLLYLVDFGFEVAVVDTINQTLCPEDSLVVGGVVFDGNNLEGLVNFGTPPAGGCDSAVYVRIDFLPVSTGSFTTSACEGDTIFVADDFYTIDDPTGTTVLDNAAANGCDSLLFVSVNFQPTAQVSINGNVNICRGDTVELTFESLRGGPFTVVLLDSEGNSYSFGDVSDGTTFDLMPTISTTYTLVDATQGGPGCPIDFGGNFSVEVSQLSASLTAGQDLFGFQISCNGAMDGALTLTVNEGVPPFTYLWSDSLTTRVRNELGPGSYAVTVTDSVGCQQTYAEDLQEPAPLLFDPRVIPPGCNERDGFLVLDTIRGGVPPYELTVDGSFFQVVSNFPYLQQLPPGDYTLMIRDMADCSQEVPLFIPEPADPELLLTQDTLIFLGDSLLLSAQTNFVPDSIRWEPGSLVSSTNTLSTFATPVETTRFFLTVSDTTGCRATANVLVSVNENVPIYVPNGFSPNTDGSNDIFSVYGNRGVEWVNVFRIFNRWGEMVYEALDFDIENPAIGWDGKHKGKDLNPQVLVYYVNATLTDGRVVELKGDLTLWR